MAIHEEYGSEKEMTEGQVRSFFQDHRDELLGEVIHWPSNFIFGNPVRRKITGIGEEAIRVKALEAYSTEPVFFRYEYLATGEGEKVLNAARKALEEKGWGENGNT